MSYSRCRNMFVTALVCLSIVLATGTVFGTPPDYGPRPISVEILRVTGADDRVDLHVTVTKGIPCDSLMIELETTGQLNTMGLDNGVLGLTRSAWDSTWGAVYDTTLRLGVAPDDTGTVVVTVKGCGMDTRCSELYVITTGDTLEIYHGRPICQSTLEGRKRVHTSDRRNMTVDTTRYTYTFDLTDPDHLGLAKFVEAESLCVPDRPLVEPGIYTLLLTESDFRHLTMEGMIGWPVGEKPDSIQVPDSTDSGSSGQN